MQRAQRIGFKIQKRNRRGSIMGRLSRGVNDQIRFYFSDERQQDITVSYVDCAVLIAGNLFPESIQNPGGIAFRPKEYCAKIIVNPNDLKAKSGKKQTDL